MTPTTYGVCDCYVWLLARNVPVGRCGRCHSRVQVLNPICTEADGLAMFVERHGVQPAPI